MNLKMVLAAVAAVVVVIVTVIILMFSGILPNPFLGLFLNPPEHSARYYPRDTLAYSWLTLYPEGGQREQMVELWDRFNEFQVVSDEIEDLREEFEENSGLTVEDDLMPWIGPDASIGVFEMDDEDLVTLLTFGVRNTGDARDFLEEYLEYLEDEDKNDFEYDEVDGMDVWVDENDGLGLALADDTLLMVSSDSGLETALEDILDLVSGKEDRSLAEEEVFQAARALLPDRRFTSVFVNIEEIAGLAADHYYSSEFQSFADAAGTPNFPQWAAASAQFIERGVAVGVVAPNADSYAQELPNLDDPADRVPSNSFGFIAATFDPNLDNWRERIEDYQFDEGNMQSAVRELYYEIYRAVERESSRPSSQKENPGMVDILDLSLEWVEAYTDVDLEEDFLDLLDGTLIMAVEEFDVARIKDDPAEETVNAVVMLSHRSNEEDALADTLEDLSDLLKDEIDVDIDSVDVGADNDAEIFSPDFSGIETGYAPGYVLHDGYLVLGTTSDALKDAVDAQKGNGDDLASEDAYKRGVGSLPGDHQFLGWVNLASIVSQLDADDFDMTEDQFEVLEESVGSVAATVNADTHHLRASLVITLFPE